MRIALKIVISLIIFCGGIWLTATIVIDNEGKTPVGRVAGLVIFPATIAGIIAVWKYNPQKQAAHADLETEFISDTFLDFVDYYNLLNLDLNFRTEELKSAYKKQAIKWHPDKNPNLDTTLRMQQINEAYLILKDYYSRKMYEKEYIRYQKYQEQSKRQGQAKLGYEVQNETLRTRILKARQKARKLAEQSLEDTIGMTIASGKAIIVEAVGRTIFFIGIALIFSLLFKACA